MSVMCEILRFNRFLLLLNNYDKSRDISTYIHLIDLFYFSIPISPNATYYILFLAIKSLLRPLHGNRRELERVIEEKKSVLMGVNIFPFLRHESIIYQDNYYGNTLAG